VKGYHRHLMIGGGAAAEEKVKRDGDNGFS